MVATIIKSMATSAVISAGHRAYTKSKSYLPTVNKNYLWGALLVGGIIIGIYYYGKSAGTVNQAPLPGDTQPTTDPTTGTTTNPLSAAESAEITRIANALHTQMGYIQDPDLQLLNDYLGSSDRVFVGTYNYYNTLFKTAPDTLKTLISKYSGWKIWFTDIHDQMVAIVARMDKLGLQ